MSRGPSGPEAVGNGRSAGVERRTLLRCAAAVLGGAFLLNTGRRRFAATRFPGGRATVLPECTGCTGCVAACPTSAIFVTPGGIAVREQDCVRCGYCMAACPVGGIRVNRERAA